MKYVIFSLVIVLFACQDPKNSTSENTEETSEPPKNIDFPEFTQSDAQALLSLPLDCVTQEFPNKLGQVLGSEADLARPKDLRPAFYGCFDWHSSVHGHWALVKLLQKYPNLPEAKDAKTILKQHLSEGNIQREIAFFKTEHNTTFERTYGWAWLFQLSTALKNWEDEAAPQLLENLMPLTELLEEKMKTFLPKLVYPIRVGEHPNTAFALNLTYDYALAFNKTELLNSIKQRAKDFYLKDENCPLKWEPSGYDFLSPCLEEARLMSKILPKQEFETWLNQFLPGIYNSDFNMELAEVGDREDGKLVHLDGLNFSRAWNLYQLSETSPKLKHLKNLGDAHFVKAYPNLIGDSYEGAHWLGTFALYALDQRTEM
ncbi:DUF2891 domain-containing protein [Psychroflexus aestuariivivens]|uniref:DUF2891 domain-containing protein n=1 Tax=Psychroflexus aestuariivivens TaxID=1795040 RepID=UPI000FD9C252|nr:DUF2891 domain-containing protein [Psychroflexus aestuariivivens]